MANVFNNLKRKSSTSAEVAENEQMNRVSSRTVGSSDSLQAQGVNNDASAFENKDGAKASGNYAYGVESRHETQETTSPFTIPKLKRSKQDLLMDISTDSREWQQEILPVLTKYFRFPASSVRYEFLRVSLIQNAERTQKYLEKRKEMRQSGYSERDITDSFAFLYVDDEKQIDRICREGLRVGNLASSTIGHPGMGAQLCRYMDTIRGSSFMAGSTGKMLVFKVMKGKVKAVTENRSGPSLEPSPNYDCHMAKSSLDITPISSQQLYELYQVYLYEYGEDQTVEPYPRHVLPYAVISFRYKEAPPSPRHLESPPMFSPRLSSPPVPKFTVSAPKEADDPEYVIWCGHLRVKDILDCEVKMVSTASQYKPAHLGTVLNVRDTCEMRVAGDRYFKELSCLRKSGEVYWKGWYINVAELRPKPDSKTQFLRLMNHLGRTESMAVLKPENDVILLLAPNSGLTNELGLTRPHHYPTMFHCIFLSRQSSKFKSPGYIQKGLHHQKSGSSTPTWFDPGQSSPLSINVSPSPRPHTAPGSPAVGFPSLGFPFHSGSDRSPGYGVSPRDELAVWTGVDSRPGDDQIEVKASSGQSEQEENRVHRNVHSGEKETNFAGTILKADKSEKSECKSESIIADLSEIKTEAVVGVKKELKDKDRADSDIKEGRLTVHGEVGTESLGDSQSASSESRFSENLSVAVSGSVSGCSWNLVSVPGALLSPGVSVISALSSASLYSSCSPLITTYVPSLLHLSQALSPSSLFPTPPLLSPISFPSPEIQMESAVSGTETKRLNSSLPSGLKPLRPLQIPKLILPDHSPTSPKPLGPYSPISPAVGLSPQLYSPISPAAVSSSVAVVSSETKQNPYSPVTPVSIPPFGPYSPISPAALMSPGPYSPISPAALTCPGPYSPISPAALTCPGPYSPISPATGSLLSGAFPGFLPTFSPPAWSSATSLSPVTASQLLSVDTPLHSAAWTVDRWSLALDRRASLSVAGKNDEETKGDQLASGGGTNALSVGRSVGSSSSSVSQSAGEEKDDVPSRAHDLLRLHRSLSTDLATQDSPGKTIPLGFDEGFLSSMPPSARIDAKRLKSAFIIQHQIQEGMALSPAETSLCQLPSSGVPLLLSPTSTKEHRDDVEQDDTITSSTSLDPTSQPVPRLRSASTDATFSPIPSPENTSEPDDTGVDQGLQVESSLLMVPKEAHYRSTKPLYTPPPNIPEYKPTPLHEPPGKRYKLDEGSRHSTSLPLERGASSSRSSSSGASMSYRSSTLNIPSVGLTHVRSPRDLPLPISPADSSTDKVKSPPPICSNINTANDMKNFLNAGLEKKPRQSLSQSRSHLTGDIQSSLSNACAFPLQAATGLASNQNEDHQHGPTSASPSGVGGFSCVPSIIVSIPFSRLLRHAVARPCRKRPWQTGERLHKAPKCTVINSQVSEASDVVHIHPSSLSRTQTSSSWCSSVTARENRKMVEFESNGQVGVKVAESEEGEAGSCRNSVEVQQQQLSTGLLQSVAKNHSPVPYKDYPHTFISCAIEDSSEDRPCDQPSLRHQTTTLSLQQTKHRSECSSQDCARGIGGRYLEIQSLDKAKQQRRELHAQQSRTMQCDEVSKNNEASVPLDVLELINRLKAIAKERMIEETVAKLMNMNASCQKSPMNPATTPPVDSLTKTCSKIEGKQFEDRQLSHAEEMCLGHIEEAEGGLLSPHMVFSSQTLEDSVADAGNDLNWQNHMKSCGIYCESFGKPATQLCEPFQGTDDSLVDSCCKHVSPLLLRRETGSVTDKFKIVKSHPTKTCTEKSSEADTSDRHIWKLMQKDNALKAEKDLWDKSHKDFVSRTEKELWDGSRRREKSAFIVDNLEPDDPLTNPTKSSLNTWQHCSDVQQVFMVHRDSGDIIKESTAHASADNLDLDDISGSIIDLIGSDVLDTNSEACDSDDIMKQIDKILSESNSPAHVITFHSTGPEEPVKEDSTKTGIVSPKPNDEEVEQKDYHQENAQNVSQIVTPVTNCEAVKNTQQIDSKTAFDNQGLDVIEEFTNDLKSSKKKKRGPRCKSQKKDAGISVSCKSSGKATRRKSCVHSLPTGSETSHGLSTVQKLGNLNTLSLKPCSVVVHDLKSSRLQLNAKDRYVIRYGEVEPVVKSPDISCNENSSQTHDKNGEGDSSHGSWESEIPVCDAPQACESLVLAELQEDAAVSIQLEGSQPLISRTGSTVFADNEPELTDKKKAGSLHMPRTKRREHSECLRKAKKCRISSDEQRLSPTCTQKMSEMPISEQAGKTKFCSPKVPKICTDLNKKQTSITGKRKVKQTLKSSLRNTYKQGSASTNHSWDDVLQEMNILSASSCSNKTPPELSRFKIPKRTKEPENSHPDKKGINLQGSQKQESDEHSASDEEMGKCVQNRTAVPVGVPGMHSNRDHSEKKNCSYRQEKQFPNKKCHLVLGNQENKPFSLSQNQINYMPVRANFLAPCRTASQSHAPSRASSTTTGPLVGQKPPENNGSQNFEYFGDFHQVSDVQQQNFQIFQLANNYPSQKKSSEEIAQTPFDKVGGYRTVISHKAMNYTCVSKASHQTGFANAQLSRDPRKRALMNRGYAGMKKTAPSDFLLDTCKESSDSDTSRVDSFNQSPYLRDSCLERDQNVKAQTSVQYCPPSHSFSEMKEFMPIKHGSAFHNGSETTRGMSSRKLDLKFCMDTEANSEIRALQENGSTQNAPQATECADIALFSPSADQTMLDRDASQTKTLPELLVAGDGLSELSQDLSNTKYSNMQQEIPQANAYDVQIFQKPVEIQTKSRDTDSSIMSSSHQTKQESSSHEILQNSPLFIDGSSDVNSVSQSVHIESPVASNGSVKKTEQNIFEQNLSDDLPVEDQIVHGVLKYSDTERLGNLESYEEGNGTVTIFTSSSVASQNCPDVIDAKIEQHAASVCSDVQTSENTVVKETMEDLEKSVQSTAKDSVDQHTSENVPVHNVPKEPASTGVYKEVHAFEMMNSEFQERSESNILHHVPDVIAVDEEVRTSEIMQECSVESVENITETVQSDGQFTKRAAETDIQLSAAEEMKVTHVDQETYWEPCVENGPSSSGNISAGKAEAWTSGLSSQSVFEQHAEVVHDANTNLSHDLMCESASSVSLVKKSPTIAVTPLNRSTCSASSPSNVCADLPASEVHVSEVIESGESLQEKVPSSSLKTQAECKWGKEQGDKEMSLPEQFTVIDECGDPDTSASIYDAILKHFSTESGFQSDLGQSQESLKGHHSENSSTGSPAASKTESNFKKPRLPRGVLFDFANTVMKNCQLNKVDEEKKKLSEKSTSSLCPSEPSSAEQTDTAGSSTMSESSSQRRRSPSQPAERQSRSRSPRNRKAPSPAGDKGTERKSSRDQRRSKSPSNRRKARSRSSIGSQAGSPSRRSEREERRPGPTRCRNREQIVEDRRHRQYRPYDAQYSRDRGRRGGWNRGHRFNDDETKPEANFNLVINEFCELLADNTTKTFQKRLDEKEVSVKTLFNDKCYKNQRFRGYCFIRSRIPSHREFRSDLAATKKKAESAKKVASIDNKKRKEPEEKAERTRLMAQLLDEYMGELDEPGKSDGARVKKTPSDCQPSATVSATSTTVVTQDPQASSSVQDTTGDDDQSSSAHASRSSSATSISGEGYSSSDTAVVSDNSRSSVQKDDHFPQETTNSSPQNDPNSFPGLSDTTLSASSPQNSHAKHSIPETFTQLNVCGTQSESTELYYQQSLDKLLDDVHSQGHLPQHTKEQRQSSQASPERADNTDQNEEEQGGTEAPSRRPCNRTGFYSPSPMHRIRSVCEAPNYDRAVLSDEQCQTIPVLVSPYSDSSSGRTPVGAQDTPDVLQSQSSSGRTPVGDQDTPDVLQLQPARRGPHTPPGPCPGDSPTLCALQTLSEDIAAFLNDESFGEGNSFIGSEPFSAGSCSGFQATSCPSKPVWESPGFSFESGYGRYQSGHILHPEQTYGSRMAGDRSASGPVAACSNTRSFSQVQVSQSEHQACSESDGLQSTSYPSNPVMESSGLRSQPVYSRFQSGSVFHPGQRYDPRMAKASGPSAAADHTRSPSGTQARDTSRSSSQTQASEDVIQTFSESWIGEKNMSFSTSPFINSNQRPSSKISASGSEPARDGPGRSLFQMCQKPDSTTVLKIINTAKVNASVSHDSQSSTVGHDYQSSTVGHDSQPSTVGRDYQSSTVGHNYQPSTVGIDYQSSTCPQPTATSSQLSHTGADTGVLPASSDTLLSAAVCTGAAGSQALAPCAAGPDVQASGRDEDGVGCEAQPAADQDGSQAKQNMDRLVLQIQQQLQAYIASVEQAGSDQGHSASVEQARNDQRRSASVEQARNDQRRSASVEQARNDQRRSVHTALHPRRRRRSRRRVRVPWKLRLWPGTPAVITFDEKRIPDYRPHPSLAKQCDPVKVTLQGADPRLDPDRPVFVPGAKSKLAANSRAKKRRVLISIKVVKDIPLEPVHQAGRELPKDPRHPFRSSVDEADHSEKEMENSSGTDLDERELGNTRFMPLENDQVVSKEVDNSQNNVGIVNDSGDVIVSKEVDNSQNDVGIVNDSDDIALTGKEEMHEIEHGNTTETSSQVIQQGGESGLTVLEKQISMCEVEESRCEQQDGESKKQVCTSECQPGSAQLDTEREETSRDGPGSRVSLPESKSSQQQEPEQLNSVVERENIPEHRDAKPKQQQSPIQLQEKDSEEENDVEHEDYSHEGENVQEKGHSEQEENTEQLEKLSEEKESHSKLKENSTQQQQLKENSTQQQQLKENSTQQQQLKENSTQQQQLKESSKQQQLLKENNMQQQQLRKENNTQQQQQLKENNTQQQQLKENNTQQQQLKENDTQQQLKENNTQQQQLKENNTQQQQLKENNTQQQQQLKENNTQQQQQLKENSSDQPENHFQHKANNLDQLESLTAMFAYKPEQEKLISEQEEIETVQVNLELEQFNTEQCDSMTEQLENISKKGANCWEQPEHNSDQVKNDSDQPEKTKQQMPINVAAELSGETSVNEDGVGTGHQTSVLMMAHSTDRNGQHSASIPNNNISAKIARKSDGNDPCEQSSESDRTEQLLVVFSPKVSGDCENLHKRKHPSPASSISLKKKAHLSTSEEACLSEDSGKSGVSGQSRDVDTYLANVTGVFHSHREALNRELLDDIMHLDSDQKSPLSGTDTTFPETPDSYSTIGNSYSSTPVADTDSCIICIEKLSGENCPVNLENAEWRECDSKTMARQATTTTVHPCEVVEVIEILSSSDSSDLEEGEIRESPPKPSYKTHQEIQPLSKSVLNRGSLSGNSSYEEGKVQEILEDGVTIVEEQFLPQTTTVSKSLGESSACTIKKSSSDQDVCMNSFHADNSDPSGGGGARNSRQTCTVSAANSTEPEKRNHSESQEMDMNVIDDCSLRISPRDIYLFENMGSLPSAINSALLELVGDICPEHTHNSELTCGMSSHTEATKPREGDSHDWRDHPAQESLPQTPCRYDSADCDLTNDIADILMDSMNGALVSGRDVFTSEVHSDSQHSLWTSSCMDLTASATVFPQENAVLNSSRKQLTQATAQNAIYPFPNCSLSCVTRNNFDHCQANAGGSFPQTDVAMQSQNAISAVKSNRPAVVGPSEPGAVYSNSVPAIGPQRRIPTIVSQNPSGPHFSGARSSCGPAGVSLDNLACVGDVRTYSGGVGPACPMYPYQNPSYYCMDSPSRPHITVPSMTHGASSARMNVDNRQLSVHNRHDAAANTGTWLTEPPHPQLTAETRYMGGDYPVQTPSQQQINVHSQSFGAYNPVPVRVPSQQFRLRGPFNHAPRNLCPVRQTGAHQHLHQMNVGMSNSGHLAFPRNPDVAGQSFMYH